MLFQHAQDSTASTGHRLSMIHGGISTHLHAVHGTPDSPGRQDIRAAVSLPTRLLLRVKVRVGPSPRLAWPFHHLNQVDAINSMSPSTSLPRDCSRQANHRATSLPLSSAPQLPSPLPFTVSCPMASTQGRYVPPHLRKAQLNAGDAPPIANNRSPVPRSPAGGSKWSSSTPPSGGNDRRPWSDRDGAHTPRGGHHHIQRDPPPHQRGSSGPSLFVFGDSFVGPFKLLSDRYSKTQTFKGSSAKVLASF